MEIEDNIFEVIKERKEGRDTHFLFRFCMIFLWLFIVLIYLFGMINLIPAGKKEK